jgi:hypothetical protein
MSPVHHHPTRFESIIAIVLVAVPLIVLIIIFNTHKGADISRFGVQTPTTEKPQSKPMPAENESDIATADLAPKGFKPFGPGESYNEENLYEKIDGKAPLYTESGFVKLYTQRYVNEKDEQLTFELYIYDMDSAENAFSVYSIQRRADSTPIEDLPFAYRTENSLYLAHGRYYCELVGSSDSPVLLDALDSTAAALIENLTNAGDLEIPHLALFPAENLVPHTFILYLNGAFGFDELTNTFSAKYKIDDQTVTAFISKQSNSDAAENLADEYSQFLLDNGGDKIVSPDPSAKYFDLFGSIEAVSVENSYVFGIHQADDRKAAETILTLIRDNLSKEQ